MSRDSMMRHWGPSLLALTFASGLGAQSSNLLGDAAYTGDIPLMTELLDSGYEPNTSAGDRPVPLERAATMYNNYHRIVRSQAGFELKCDEFERNRREAVQLLLTRGAKADGRGAGSFTPLMTAVSGAECPNRNVVKMLIAAGADVNAQWSGSTPLTIATESGYASSVYDLLRAGANPNFRDKQGLTPLMVLATQSDPHKPEVGRRPLSCEGGAFNETTEKFANLVDKSDLSLTIPLESLLVRTEWRGLTVQEVLAKRLGGRCQHPSCDGKGLNPLQSCLEQMYGWLERKSRR